jgi:hypothetical protein
MQTQTQIQEQPRQMSLEQWARTFGVSTRWDPDKFENREFLKRLDEAKFIWEPKKQSKA